MALADTNGLEGFSMRQLAQELGVVPMALYKHVANKDELLDGMVDIVFSEIESPSIDDDWRTAMRRRAISVRAALNRHQLGDRTDGNAEAWSGQPAKPQRRHGLPARSGLLVRDGDPRLLRPGRLHIRLRAAGEDARVPDTARCRSGRPATGTDHRRARATTPTLPRSPPSFPRPVTTTPVEFAWGLDLILDSLDRHRDTPQP